MSQTPNIVFAGFTGDRSGSMGSMKNAPSDGLFGWINEQKKSVEDNSQVGKFFVSTFDDKHEIRIDGQNIADTHVTLDQCKEWMEPRSTTKLYDSAITDLDRLIHAKADYEKNMPKSLKTLDPKIVTVWACMTDGDDNESTHTMVDFKNKVKEAQRKYDIKCFFLGANQDAIMTGRRYGFQEGCSLTFGSTERCAGNALRSVTQVMRQASSGEKGACFTDNMRISSAPPAPPTPVSQQHFNSKRDYYTSNNVNSMPSFRQPSFSLKMSTSK